ncbi:MAG: 30S ribosomal protein S16 [Bacillota bacterium]|jgi:small subunit ribosomal protein S16
MATRIRLRRMGAKKAPFYRIVVADSRSPRDGRFIEELGYYNPTTDPSTVHIDQEKAASWVAKGVQMSDTVRRLFEQAGVIKRD